MKIPQNIIKNKKALISFIKLKLPKDHVIKLYYGPNNKYTTNVMEWYPNIKSKFCIEITKNIWIDRLLIKKWK